MSNLLCPFCSKDLEYIAFGLYKNYGYHFCNCGFAGPLCISEIESLKKMQLMLNQFNHNTIKIRPCPRCKSLNIDFFYDADFPNVRIIGCRDCEFMGSSENGLINAVKSWQNQEDITEGLEPCLYCNHKADIAVSSRGFSSHCPKCNMFGPDCSTKEEAIKIYNEAYRRTKNGK